MGVDMIYCLEVYNPQTMLYDEHDWKGRYVLNPEKMEADPFFLRSRNYPLFSLLGSVCQDEDEDDYITPIDFDRGIPHDACDEIIVRHHRGDPHSASYVMLDELLEYDWDSIPDKFKDDKGLKRFREMTMKAMCRLVSDTSRVRLTFFFNG